MEWLQWLWQVFLGVALLFILLGYAATSAVGVYSYRAALGKLCRRLWPVPALLVLYTLSFEPSRLFETLIKLVLVTGVAGLLTVLIVAHERRHSPS